jgi:hypothetical protein
MVTVPFRNSWLGSEARAGGIRNPWTIKIETAATSTHCRPALPKSGSVCQGRMSTFNASPRAISSKASRTSSRELS